MRKIITSCVFMFLSVMAFAGNYVIAPFTYSWCTTTYPTSYVAVSWTLSEATSIAGTNALTKNQSGKTIIIDLPNANFEFNTAAASAAIVASGTEISLISFAYTTSQRITVTLTSSATNAEYNTLSFNNFEIRAIAASSGNVKRNGGTFKVDNSTGKPVAAEYFGSLFSGSPFTLTSTTCSHPSTANVSQYTINNQILKVEIAGTGSACNADVTQFIFDTDGGNGTGTNLPAVNITTAKLYYTGTTNTFATTNLYGSFASPNGAFTIAGSQAMAVGTNYFWLVYDVPGDANTGGGSNLLDASLTSYVLNGSTISGGSLTTPTPAGSRTIIPATFYYSMNTGNWSSTSTSVWSTTSSAGPTCSCAPNGSGVLYISHAITLDQDRTADVVEIQNGGSLTGAKILTVNTALTTAGTGYFTLTKEMWVKGNMTLAGTGSSSNTKQIEINGDLDVGVGTTLTGSGGNGQEIFVGGALTVDGNLTESGSQEVFLNGGFNFIDGTGTITCSKLFIGAATAINSSGAGGNKSVNTTANLTITGGVQIEGAFTVTNNGIVSISGNLDGSSSSSNWTNAASSYLKYGGSADMFVTSGVLQANGSSNTVEYNRNGNQNIVVPFASQYYHLLLSTGGTKTMAAADILVGGNLTFNAAFDGTTNSKKITFNGGSAQLISGTTAPTFYDLSITNTHASGVALQVNATVSNILTIGGILDIGGSGKTLTINNAATTAISRSSGYILSENTANTGILKWNIASTTGSHVYPFGNTSGYYIPFTLNLTAGTIGNVSVSTYPTAAANTPMPAAVTHVMDVSGADNSANTVNRFWQIDKDGASGTADVTFTYGDNEWDASEPSGADEYNAQRWNSVTAGWDSPIAGQAVSTASNTVTVPGVATFSPWTLAKKSSPLPVKWGDFELKKQEKSVDLNWTTLSEINTSHFDIERASTTGEFIKVGMVKASGNSTAPINYAFTDHKPIAGESLYRLKQFDIDGKFDYSVIRNIKFESLVKLMEAALNVYPNPVDIHTHFNISFSGFDGEEVLVVLQDVTGKVIAQRIVVNIDGQTLSSTELTSHIPAGIYIVVASSDDHMINKKLMIR